MTEVSIPIMHSIDSPHHLSELKVFFLKMSGMRRKYSIKVSMNCEKTNFVGFFKNSPKNPNFCITKGYA